jgi:hypothetical protein
MTPIKRGHKNSRWLPFFFMASFEISREADSLSGNFKMTFKNDDDVILVSHFE